MIISFINFYSKEDIMNLENYKLNTSQVHNNGGTLYKIVKKFKIISYS